MNENQKNRFVYNAIIGLAMGIIAAIVYVITHWSEVYTWILEKFSK